MPVNNKVLKICSVLDPIMRNTTQARQLLGQIPSRTNLVQNDQDTVDRFHREVNKYTYDVSPSSASEDAPVDVWWGGVSQDRFPLLCAAAKALLSCFHGPIVESTFSEMGKILSKEKTNMDVDTYMAMQTVKSRLATAKKTAVEYFAKADPIKEPVSKQLVENMRNAWIDNEERKATNQETRNKLCHEMGLEPDQKLPSKAKEKRKILDEAVLERKSSKKQKTNSQNDNPDQERVVNGQKADAVKDNVVNSQEDAGEDISDQLVDVAVVADKPKKQAKLSSFFRFDCA
ncbi:uncharacterized protein LOC112562188 [Pomacea canaliculata]|uniref:uncharacterized protein LOC112562188 n=1 Tax=Pomacea canaliculata TaxID=400727 RepID=UPI000D72930E|nr:uncharacterized protein LOC112562188 [Pomacea canaliculata]